MLRVLPFRRFICEQVAIDLPGKFWKGFCGTKHVYRRNSHGCFASVRYCDNALLPRHILKYVREGCLYFFVIDNVRHGNTLLRLNRIYCSTFYRGRVWRNRQTPWLRHDPTVSPPSGAPCAVQRPRLSRPDENGAPLAVPRTRPPHGEPPSWRRMTANIARTPARTIPKNAFTA